MNVDDVIESLSHEELEVLAEDCEDFLVHRYIPLNSHSYYNIVRQAFLEGYQYERFDRVVPPMDPRPLPIFSHEELAFLQDVLDDLRAVTFNDYMEAKHRDHPYRKLYHEYQLTKSIRDKVYHLGGRDTLALGDGYHEQRWWDQFHDY